MKHFYFSITCMFMLIFCSSCGSMNGIYSSKARGKAGIKKLSQFTDSTKGTFMWSHFDITKRSSIVYISPEGRVRVLSENPPDAALQTISEISSKVKITDKVNVEAALKTQKSIAEMGKRTAAVNMLRDALYRINEMYYSSEQTTKEMMEILDTSKMDDMKKIMDFRGHGMLRNLHNID